MGSGIFDFLAANSGPQQQQDPADMLGGGGVGLSHGDAMTLSLLNAMQQQAQAGTQRTASPIGSIAGALGPLLAAPIQARQMEQQSMMQERAAQARELGLQLQSAQLAIQLKKMANPEADLPKTLIEGAARAVAQGQDPTPYVDAFKQMQQPKAPTVAGIASQLAGGDPQATFDKLKELNAGSAGATAAASAAARMPYEAALHQQNAQYDADLKAGTKKPLPAALVEGLAKQTQGLETLNDVVSQFEKGKVSKYDAGKAYLTGGLISNETLREYNTYYNDVANKRFKSRFTSAENERLAQELPKPQAYILDPQGFIKSLRVAQKTAAAALQKEHDYTSRTFDMPIENTQDVQRVVGAARPPTSAGREASIKMLMDKTGWDRARAEAALNAQ